MNHKPSASFQLSGIVWDNQLQACLSVESEKIINHKGRECILSRGLGTVAVITAWWAWSKDDDSCVPRNYSAVKESRTSANSRARMSMAWLMVSWISFFQTQWCRGVWMPHNQELKEEMLATDRRNRQFKCSRRLLPFGTKAIPQMSYK